MLHHERERERVHYHFIDIIFAKLIRIGYIPFFKALAPSLNLPMLCHQRGGGERGESAIKRGTPRLGREKNPTWG